MLSPGVRVLCLWTGWVGVGGHTGDGTQTLSLLNHLMLWPAGGGALCPASVSLSLSQTQTHACKRVLESLLWGTCPLWISFPPILFSTRVQSGFFLGWLFKVLSITEGIRCVQRQTQQDKRLCLRLTSVRFIPPLSASPLFGRLLQRGQMAHYHK